MYTLDLKAHSRTPLWPAGHLPLKGGDHSLRPFDVLSILLAALQVGRTRWSA